MSLPSPTIKKIIANLPARTAPAIRVQGEREQREFLEEWRREIEKADRACKVQMDQFSYRGPQMNLYLISNAQGATGSTYGRNELQLFFDKDVLLLRAGYTADHKLPLSSLDQMWEFLDAFRVKLIEKAGQVQKQQKVRDLRARSAELQIEDLAQRLQFAYQIIRKQIKVVLVVQINAQRSLYIDIPLGKLQETIDRLEGLILHVRNLYDEGLRIKIAAPPYGHFQMPKPKPVE